MAGAGSNVQIRGLSFNATVLTVVSPTVFTCNLKNYGNNFFQGWDVWVVRNADGTGAPPQGTKVECTAYVSSSGQMTLSGPFGAAPLLPQTGIYLIQPYVSENVNTVDQPSNNVKQSVNTEVSNHSLVYATLAYLVFAGAVGAARIKFDLKVNVAGGTANAVVYHNGVPVVTNPAATPNYTVWQDTTGVYHTITQDVSGLSLGDTVEVWGEVLNPVNAVYIRNFQICYDIVNLPSVQAVVQGVYIDTTVNGVAGTAWPIGLAKTQPVNNWADAQAILTANNLLDVYLVHGVITLTANISGYHFHGNSFSDPSSLFQDNVIEFNGFSQTNCSFDEINIDNATGGVASLVTCGPFINCSHIRAGSIVSCSVFINCPEIRSANPVVANVYNGIVIGSGATITAAQVTDSTLYSTGTGFVADISNSTITAGVLSFPTDINDCIIDTPTMTTPSLLHNCQITNPTIMDFGFGLYPVSNFELSGAPVTVKKLTAGILNFSGDFTLTIDASCTAGTINVYGNVHLINNTGGTTVNDYTNKLKAETSVNINAILAGETNFLNLVGQHYTVDDLVLKSADPGANLVYVKLYKLVNGMLTAINVDSVTPNGFVITTLNYTRYWSLNDMFGRDILAGDNIKITVQASGGGPYVVTGSYAYRSA